MEIIITICVVAALIMCTLVWIYRSQPIQDLLKAKLDKEQLETISFIVKSWVGYAKQVLTSSTGAEKKAFVIKKVIDELDKHGIIVTEDDFEYIIEDAYLEIKDKGGDK